MSKLISARNWIREKFEPGSRPTLAQVTAWIEADEVPGVIIAGRPWVYADRFDVKPPKPEKVTAYNLLM